MGGVIYAQPKVTNSDATSIDTGKYYYLRNRGRGMKYVNECYDGYMALSSTITDYWVTYIIRFEADGNNYKVKLWNDKYLTTSASSQAVYAGDEAISVSASYTADNQWAFKNLSNNLYFNGNDWNFVYWGSTQDAGNGSYYVEETDLTDALFTEAVEALKIVTFNVTKLDGSTTSSTGFFLAGATPVVPVDAVENLADYTFTQNGDNYNFVASSQLSTDFANAKWYNMVIRSYNNYVAYSANEPYGVNKSATRAQLASAPYQWALIGDMTNGVKMVNKETGESYTLTANGSNAVLREEQVTWDIDVNNNTVTIDGQAHKGFVLKVAGTDNNYINQNGGDGGTFQFWDDESAKNDQGSTMFFIEAPELQTYNVTYNVKYNGVTVASAVSAFEEGATIGSEIPSELNRDYVTLTAAWNASQTVNADTEVDVTATWNDAPFQISTIETPTWYTLKIRDNGSVTNTVLTYQSAANPNVQAEPKATGLDNQQWAFVGNPYELSIINRANTAVTLGTANNNNGTVATLGSDGTKYYVTSSTNIAGKDGFYIRNTGNGYGLNLQNDQLKYWNGLDVGSTFTVEDVPEITEFASLVESEIYPYIEKAGQYFSLKSDVVTTNWNESYLTTCDKTTYENLTTIVNTLSNFKLPETGYYCIKNKNTYASLYANGCMALNAAGTELTTVNPANAAANYSTMIKLTKVSDMVYTISTQGLNLEDLTLTAEAGSDFTFTIKAPSIVSMTAGVDGSSLHWQEYGNKLVHWNSSADASHWIIEDATSINITLNDGGDEHTYATLYVPFGVTLPADGGVDAYVISTNSSNHATTVNIGKNIPAATPVILRGTATSVTATINDDATATVGTNLLQGTYTERTLGENDVVLGKSATTGIGFYKSSAALGANKAYLDLSGSSVKSFILDFDDDATGIEKTLSDSHLKDENIYNLAGQRIQKMQKGLYIVNGKKVLVK